MNSSATQGPKCDRSPFQVWQPQLQRPWVVILSLVNMQRFSSAREQCIATLHYRWQIQFPRVARQRACLESAWYRLSKCGEAIRLPSGCVCASTFNEAGFLVDQSMKQSLIVGHSCVVYNMSGEGTTKQYSACKGARVLGTWHSYIRLFSAMFFLFLKFSPLAC